MTKTSEMTAVLNKSMTDETKEQYKDLIAFGMEIDFTPLFQAISKKLGLVNALEFSKPMIEHRNRCFYVECESVNIADRVGILASVLDRVGISFFNSCIKKDGMNGRYFFCASVHFSYQHIVGGSNGLEFATVWFDNETGWTFRFVEPQNRD